MITRRLFYKVYRKLQGVIVPGLRYSQDVYEEVLNRYVRLETRWLDIGCGHQLLPSWRSSAEVQLVRRCRSVVGLDYDVASLRTHATIPSLLRGDIRELPFSDGSFDLVTANMVVEHLEDPVTQFREVHRVLAPGGIFLFHTPNVLGYPTMIGRIVPERLKPWLITLIEGRKEEDVFETHYRANSRRRVEALADEAGFVGADIKMIMSSAVFVILPPLLIPELIWIRLLLTKPFRPLRTNIIGALQSAPGVR